MADNPTSLTLIDRLRAADADAWARLLTLYSPLVRYWLGRAGIPPGDADDLVQEVFREVSQALPVYRRDRPEDTFRRWLRGVCRIAVLRHRRATGRQPRAAGGTVALDHLHAVPDAAPPDDEDDPPDERNALYHRALELVRREFEEKTWRMFWATTVERRATAEVAAEVGVSTAAVRQAKSRVLRRLREEVGDLAE